MFTAAELKERQLGIGASEAAACLGLSRYKSPLDVYVDKTKETPKPQEDSAISKRGHRLEPIVLDMYEEDYGQVQRLLPKFISKEHPFMYTSLDARRKDDLRPVEAKTAGKYVAHEWGEEGTDQIPQEYLIQLVHQMIVTGAHIGDIAALLTLDDFRKYTIELDTELAEMVVAGLRNFWARVENRQPPEPTSGEDAERFYRKSVPQGIAADTETAIAYHELLEIRAAIKPLEKKEAELIGNIKLFMREREALIVDSVPCITWRSSKGSNRLNAQKFKLLYPSVYEKCCEETEGSRRFLVKEA